jgi:diaminohydroxyphosphoribosylaminopyrimidine deaminase / 5-amino-6-(5-phosphoribosylamino)uracil reductase
MPANLTFLYFWRLMTSHEIYMYRCLELARLGEGKVAPNPMVGSILVYEDKIIGEGYHQQYGGPHAEPNCVASVKDCDVHLIERSTLYVSLEPCAHFGKTPPCADLVIQKKIPKVVIGCRDPFVQVNGKGIEKLKSAGVEVEFGTLEEECKGLNKRFFAFHTQHRPYVILKWAQTLDNKIANEDYSRLHISNEHTNRIVHKWRGEEMAIAVGTNTALFDDPELTTRLSPGRNQVRIVVDMDLRLPSTLKLFNSQMPTIVFNTKKHTLPIDKISGSELEKIGVRYYQVTEEVSLVHQMMNALYRIGIQSILVEGGTYFLQSFIDEGIWDEARVITNEQLSIGGGLSAPVLKNELLIYSQQIFSDSIRTYKNTKTNS